MPTRTSATFGAVIGAIVLLAGWMVAGSVPRSETEARLSDGAAWLTSTEFGGISLHDGGDGAAMTNLQVAAKGDDFAVVNDGAHAIVVNSSTGEVSRVDAATWSIASRVPLADPGEGVDIIVGAERAWVARSGSVAPIELSTLALRSPAPVGDRLASAAVTGDGALLFSGEAGDSPLMQFSPGVEPESVDGLAGPASFASLTDGVAALDQDTGVVWLEGAGVVCDQLEVPPGTLMQGAGSGRVFVAVADSGSVFAWNPATGCPTTSDFLSIGAGTFGAPVVADGWAVIPDVSTGEVVVIDLEAVSVIRRRAVLDPETNFDLVGEDDSIWFNDPSSSSAGLVKPNGDIIEIEKYSDEGDGGFAIAPTNDPNADLEVASPEGDPDTDESSDDSGNGDDLPIDETVEREPAEQDAASLADEAPDLAEPDLGATESQPLPEPQLDVPSPDQPVGEDLEGSQNDALPPAGPTTNDTEPDPDDETDEPAASDISVSIQQSKLTAEVGDLVTFRALVLSGDPTTFRWSLSPDPGGAGSSTGLEISRVFDEPGLYSIQLTACDEGGETCDGTTRTLQVVDSAASIPVAVSISAPAQAVIGQQVDLVAVVEGDPDSVTWSIQDGSPATASGVQANTIFDSPGSKTVTVTAERGEERRTDSVVIVVGSEADPAEFIVRCSPSSQTAGEAVQCSINGFSTAVFSDVSWSFSSPNDSLGSISESAGTASVSYDGEGAVTVSAVATDIATGDSVSDSASVSFVEEVVAPPNPQISGPTEAEAGQSVTFSVSNEGGEVESFSWSAEGTSASGSGSSFSATWDAAGTYTVTVFAAGLDGDGTDTHTIVIGEDVPPPCGDDVVLSQPTVSATYVSTGRVDVTVTANKCVTADLNWRNGNLPTSSELKTSHTFVITGLTEGDTYSFSTTVNDGTDRRFGSTEIFVGPGGTTTTTSPEGPIVISNFRATPTSPTSVELSATTNICVWSDWSGTAVNRDGPRPDCFTSHNHKNPDWRGSIALSPGGTYSATLTAHDPDGVWPSVSQTITFTMPEAVGSTDDPDGDGIPTSEGDNCPNLGNPDQGDNDGDGIGNVCDPDWGGATDDPDGDGWLTSEGDNCPDVSNIDQADSDGDGIGNVCDLTPDGDPEPPADTDGDGVNDDVPDNCLNDPNADQADNDGDGIGNVCDLTPDGDPEPPADTDGDGVNDDVPDNCLNDPNADQADNDGDGIGNVCDSTPDGDPTPPEPDPDDPDGDGVFTSAGDNCPGVANGGQEDNDGDGIGNACDPTPDGDPAPPPDE